MRDLLLIIRRLRQLAVTLDQDRAVELVAPLIWAIAAVTFVGLFYAGR